MAAGLILAVMGNNTAQAYSTYAVGTTSAGNCSTCHGNFQGTNSTKGTVFPSGSNHTMHNGSGSMNTACDLCHFGTNKKPVYTWKSNGTANNTGIGCSGCHAAAGLQTHHVNHGVTVCLDCHDPIGTPDPENVNPPYYGTADTKVRNAGNTLQVANTNENWSVGDFLGLDNDGNGLYDLADYTIGPFRILSTVPEGNNIRVTWQTAGGRTNTVQAASSVSGTYANLSSAITRTNIGVFTTNYLEVGGANKAARFYRIKSTYP
jgi:hypothetical protein